MSTKTTIFTCLKHLSQKDSSTNFAINPIVVTFSIIVINNSKHVINNYS